MYNILRYCILIDIVLYISKILYSSSFLTVKYSLNSLLLIIFLLLLLYFSIIIIIFQRNLKYKQINLN